MGIVYRAVDLKLKREVALKVLPPELVSDAERKRRFIQEAEAAAALDHPHIATIFEIDEAEGESFIAMELIRGEKLRDLTERGRLSLARSLELATEIAEGLARAHDKGIVHRDLKPGNIMVTEDEHAKIIDFGLAKLVEPPAAEGSDIETALRRETDPGIIMGTVSYMSPEQARGTKVDHRSDIFSFGVVLYEMLTGETPFKGATRMDTLSAILKEPVPQVALGPEAMPETASEVQRILDKCLAKDPSERYQTMKDLAVDLRAARRRLESGTVPRIAPAPRRKRWSLAVGGVAAIVALLMGFNIDGVREWGRKLLSEDTVSFSERDWLLVIDFENLTGEDIFDKSLNTALHISLGQSSYINVFPASRIHEALRRMKREDVQRIDEATGREIAEREGLRLVLAPNITGIGGVYVLSAAIQDATSGGIVLSESVRVENKAQVLSGLDELSKKIRQDLGEATAAISKQSKPLAKVTTSSLEALKQLSLATEKLMRESNFEEARVLYEDALRIDPSFTAAKAALGMLHWDKFDRETGKALLAAAVDHADALTDLEKYSVLAFHAQGVENNLPKALGYWKALLALYPDRSNAHNNLGRVYQQMWRFDDAIAEYRAAIRLDPYLMLSYYSLNSIYLYDLGRVDDAIALCKQQIAHNDQHVWAYDQLGWAYLGKGDLEQARAAFEKALEINPALTRELYRLGHTYRLQRKYREALQTFLKVKEVDPKEIAPHYDAGVVSKLMGDETAARKYFEDFRTDIEKRTRSNPKDASALFDLALVLTRLGDSDRGRSVGQKAMTLPRRSRSATRSVSMTFPAAERSEKTATIGPDSYFDLARLLSVQGERQQAVDALETAVEKGYRNYIWMKVHVDLQNLVDEPRFQALLARGLNR